MTIDLKLHCDFKKGERGRERRAIGLSFKLGHISGLVYKKQTSKHSRICHHKLCHFDIRMIFFAKGI